jgi:hypothetical protein
MRTVRAAIINGRLTYIQATIAVPSKIANLDSMTYRRFEDVSERFTQ